MVKELSDLWASWSPAIQAAVIAGGVAMLGFMVTAMVQLLVVWVTNKGHATRLRIQITADDARKRLDREMDLRKTIYLDLAQAVQAALRSISKHSDLHISHAEVTKAYEASAAALAKVQVIGGMKLIEPVLLITRDINAAFWQLSIDRAPALKNLADMKIIQNQVAGFESKRDEYQARRIEEAMKPNADQHMLTRLDQWYEFESNRVTEAIGKMKALEAEFADLQAELLGKVQTAMVNVGNHVPQLLYAARLELDLIENFDVSEYRSLLSGNIASDKVQLQVFIDEFLKLRGAG